MKSEDVDVWFVVVGVSDTILRYACFLFGVLFILVYLILFHIPGFFREVIFQQIM